MKEEKYCLFHNTILLCFGIKVEFKESQSKVTCLYTQLIVFVYTLQCWDSLAATFPNKYKYLSCPFFFSLKIADEAWYI